ncbi:ATP-binding cassette domain-containing protein [Arcobacter sp. CECT 8985]|uniref:ATP-binding cassette domain-containing protein n=1 Tax=Arcobacter sp. CECT 8985 TaxID=1935424 RepID=UPI00100BB62D|nr:ATP-binding cassette domain-containing protein [Arcobacter sp. CECT 8985]RXJ88051.1 daunorubicin resistance protein DrrC [Arcobacter sp. CECT 8985]
MNKNIVIKNATTNNLKNISIDIPKNKIIAVTGVSGSGKSSFVFDTIASQSQRLLNETYSSYIQDLLPKYKKPTFDSISNLPVSLVINQKRIEGNSRSTVGTITDIYTNLRLLFSRIAVPFIGYSMNYSFNNTEGMCSICKGLGEIKQMNIKRLIDFDKSLNQGAILFPTFQNNGWRLSRYTESGFFNNDKKISQYSKEELDLLLYSKEIKPVNPTTKWHKTATYLGVVPRIENVFINSETTKYKKELNNILDVKVCPQCKGTRLNNKALSAKIMNKSIADCSSMSINELFDFINKIDDEKVSIIINDLKKKLKSLQIVGLDYLSLNRNTNTLSGGESQRIKMTKYLNSSLSDVLYIFDEPTIGLHPHDIKGIVNIFKEIKNNGNSILFVDHDKDIISICDKVINFGEKAGINGGNITFYGIYEELLNSNTITAKAFLKKHNINEKEKDFSSFYTLDNVSKNNIKNLSVKIPKNALTLVTGVAGSGKSTLIRYLFKNKYPKAAILDQSLPHTSVRSNITTYINIYNEIKKLFAKANSVNANMFSATGKGACLVCKGKGFIKLDLAYLGDSTQVCEKCKGKRFNDTALSYYYKNKNISEIFDLSVQEALELFFDNTLIRNKLESIVNANLDYIKLGQTLDTFSGGELQRLKIAKMLSENTDEIIILDEPSTGLHEADIENLIKLFNVLIKQGHTLIVLEHNLSIISQADWIIDLGLKGGSLGGKLLYQGYLKNFLNNENSFTAKYLKEFL